jgi:hypothetical protein
MLKVVEKQDETEANGELLPLDEIAREGALWSAKTQPRSRSIVHEEVLVVESVQYGTRHHSTSTVETMPLALERHG